MTTTATYNFPRSRDGRIFWYPDTLGHAWCAVHYAHNERTESGTITFYVAETELGGTDIDITDALRNQHLDMGEEYERQYPNRMKLETLKLFNLTLTAREVDGLFGNELPYEFWSDWLCFAQNFELGEVPDRLINFCNLVYENLAPKK